MYMGEFANSTSVEIEGRVQREPSNASLRFFLGLKRAEENKLNYAADAFAKALQLSPDYDDAKFYLGKVRFELGWNFEAEEVLLTLPEHSSYAAKRDLLLAELYLRKGQLTDARDYFLKAIASGELLGCAPHLGLEKLLSQGVDVGVANPAAPLVDTRISCPQGAHTAYARMQIFKDREQPSDRVVLFRAEASAEAEQRIGPSVSNAIESLIEFAVGQPELELNAAQCTWVTMYEAPAMGQQPMRITRIVAEVSVDQGKQRACAKNVAFRDITHGEFEQLTGYKVYWAE